MRADDNINTPRFHIFFGLFRLSRRNHARELRDANREACKTRRKIIEMLTRQKRCWHDYGNLQPCLHDGEGSAERDLRFAKPDIAADQSVHRLAAG